MMWDSTFVYCLNGHYVGMMHEYHLHELGPGRLHDLMMKQGDEEVTRIGYCTQCGVESVFACESCGAIVGVPDKRPAYCGSCGNPFPWTATALEAAKEYADELDSLSTDEKTSLKGTFNDLTSDTARTPLAASRFKRAMEKIGPAASDTLSKIVVNFVTEAAKKLTGL